VRDALVHGEVAHGLDATRRLVRHHAAHDAEQNASRGARMDRALLGVCVGALVEPVMKLELVAEQRARDVDLLRADADLLF
jgi:hypothetical protein